jgi:molecular chaperone DnaJ
MKNYYEILDVACDADPDALKKAYRLMAKKVHPDHQQGDAQAEERFKELQEAYEVLSHPVKRVQYDTEYLRKRVRAGSGSAGRRSPPSGTRGKTGVADRVEDVFEMLKDRMKNKGKRGEDHRYMLSLSLEEAAKGVKKIIHIPRGKTCSHCSGRGWNTVASSPVCQTCSGQGEITVARGSTRTTMKCPHCRGTGLNEKIPCHNCRGKGIVTTRLKRAVEIPAGVDNGSRLKIRGEGGPGETGCENGDLYIIIQVKDHKKFRRENLDIWLDLPLHFTDAALGAKFEVPTLHGVRSLAVPPGTQSGEVFVLKGCGMPGLNGSRTGDQKVRVHVRVPRKMTRNERTILKGWREMRHAE